MLAQEIIRIKRDGGILTPSMINEFVQGLVDNSWSEGQASALAMAIFFNGTDVSERVSLTQAMKNSGEVLKWEKLNLPGPILDKHSTGGVGDKVSLMLAPMVAACGAFVPMISGRGLGHTGGTLDKFDSIPGYQTAPTIDKFFSTVQKCGCAIIGQTSDLAPADRRLYGIRDVTATVESIGLITASILSKKLSAGLQGLVMDVKVGNGAFADNINMARDLANSLVTVANKAGLPTTALLTDMNQVLGDSVGNALEMLEAINFLQFTENGKNIEPRLLEVTLALAVEMLINGKICKNSEEAKKLIITNLNNGNALERFAKMVSLLGGPTDLIENPTKYLTNPPIICAVPAPRSGVVTKHLTRDLGIVLIELGGGRRKAVDKINHQVGFNKVAQIGTKVNTSDPIAVVFAHDEITAQMAMQEIQRCIIIEDVGLKTNPTIIEKIS